MIRLSKAIPLAILIGGVIWSVSIWLSEPEEMDAELAVSDAGNASPDAPEIIVFADEEAPVVDAYLDEVDAPKNSADIDLALMQQALPGSEDMQAILDAAWKLMQNKRISKAEYNALLLDLEEWIHTSGADRVQIWNYLQAQFGQLPEVEDLPGRRDAFIQDISQRFAFVWGAEDPRKSLEFVALNPNNNDLMEGWLTSQIYNQVDFDPLLQEMRITPPIDVVWLSLRGVARLDAFVALDFARDNYHGEMTPKQWKALFDTSGGANDDKSIAWIEANQDLLINVHGFDPVEVARLLRRYNYGGEIFYDSADVETINNARTNKQFAMGAEFLEQMKAEYGEIDSAAINRFPLEWSYQDFAAAESWLLANESYYSDPDAYDSALGTMFRHKAQKDPVYAREHALALTDEWHRALATSNVVIPEVEKGGLAVDASWVSEMPQGFPKQRTIAGYVLGLSRNASEPNLEGQVKAHFLRDQFDLNQISQFVHQSNLSQAEKVAALEILQSY